MGADGQGGSASQGGRPRLIRTWRIVPLLGVRSLTERVFDYLPPAPSSKEEEASGKGADEAPPAEPGRLVRVPFGRRSVVGVVVGEGDPAEVRGLRLRPVAETLPRRLGAEALALAQALAEHYMAPLGAALSLLAPLPGATSMLGSGREVVWVVPHPDTVPTRPLTARQKTVLQALPAAGIPVAEVCRSLGCTRPLLNALVAAGAADYVRRRQAGPPAAAPAHIPRAPLVLSPDQERALDRLREVLRQGRSDRVLLWGVTGSGKTEIYVRLLQDVIAAGRGAIVLVPEIALTDALRCYLEDNLGVGSVIVVHSGLTPAMRARALRAIEAGEAKVVVGPRSAVFAPLSNLGLIIIDESHDPAYKNEEEPHYHARWVAQWRARYHGALLVEGTATPRLETLAETTKTLRLRTRPTGALLPAVEIIDMRRQGGAGVLSPRAAARLRDTVASGEQAILLVNRRGHSTYLFCPECGHVQMCPRCDISLTLHRGAGPQVGGTLVCHHCGHREPEAIVCPECGAATMARGPAGTQRLEEELGRILSPERIFRLDSDVAGSARRAVETLRAFGSTGSAVLIGTQMVAKGHDFPAVSLVVVVDADASLYFPDFRAAERTFQLLRQVVGRAGRRREQGVALLQTWNPDAPCIRMAVRNDERSFYEQELEERNRLGFPPAVVLTRLVLAGPPRRTQRAATVTADECVELLGAGTVRGPTWLPRLRGSHRWQVLLGVSRSEKWPPPALASRIVELRGRFAREGVDLVVDVDPEWFG